MGRYKNIVLFLGMCVASVGTATALEVENYIWEDECGFCGFGEYGEEPRWLKEDLAEADILADPEFRELVKSVLTSKDGTVVTRSDILYFIRD